MKFNVEVEIDWLDEDWTLDEKFQSELNKRIEDKMVEKLITGVDKDVARKVQEKVEKAIDSKINTFIDEFMDKSFNKTDKWGDVIETNVTVKELLKERLDNFLNENVDKNGEVSNYSYDNKNNRIEYVLNNVARKHINTYQKGISDEILKKIKEDINEETRNKVVDSILSDYSLKKLINPLS